VENTGTTPDLVLEGLVKSFGAVRAVDSVSLSVRHGEFFSLLGPSGCGKTTTLRLVAGFERPDAGRILLAGSDVSSVPPNKRRVNTVFQQYALFPHMTVEDNVAYGLKHNGTSKDRSKERVETALETVRMTSMRTRYPRQLSGGQQQRVALARALINEPTVLLLDEPLAALDLKLRKAMQGELKKLQEQVGITFVYVTHDQEEALTLSDRIAVMNEGKVLQEGTPDEIYERPTSRFVADFIGQTNFFDGVVEEVGPPVTVREKGGSLFRCAPADFARPGMNVVVSIRPERMEPAKNGSAANAIEGTFVRRTYLGDLVHYHVLLAGGSEVTMQRQNDRDDAASEWNIGQRVQMTWEEESALVLEPEGGVFSDDDESRLVEATKPGE
jgi:spermidine/putrescine transport system ATP-binding protein